MLITELAYFFLLFAFVLSLIQFIIPAYGVFTDKPHLQALAPKLAFGQFLALFLSFSGLMAGFYYNDFSLIYVANHSNSLLPWYYKLSASWGGHEGSLLLWVTILAGWGAMVCFRLPDQHSSQSNKADSVSMLAMKARVLSVLAGIQFMMLAMLIFSSSPFERSFISSPFAEEVQGVLGGNFKNAVLTLPVDGADLNPLLQDVGLIVHPPLLYMGYVGMAIPFAFCISALWAGRLDSRWTRSARPWALLAWGFLTLGIALGSWWAYYELGWGGWWFWDPVENASLLPWLVCTALIHSLTVTQKQGVFKAWTIMLAIFAFALSLLGTFLVRSGVITSVHSFASDPTRGMLILVILAVVIGSGLTLFALRGWRLTVDNSYEIRSRESLLVINNIIILVATLVVLLGTLYPIIADAVGWGQVSVGAPYFNALFVPLSWLLLLTMGIGVVTRWRRDSRPMLGVSVMIGASVAVLAGMMAFFVRFNSSLNVGMTLALCLWVLAWSIYDVKTKLNALQSPSLKMDLSSVSNTLSRIYWERLKKLSARYWGMHLAHLGVLMMAVGIAVTTSQSVEKDVAMGIGDAVEVQGYTFIMQDLYESKGQNYDGMASEIIVSKQGKQIASLHPEKRTYVVSMMPMTEASIDANLWRDVYVALGEPIEKADTDQASSAHNLDNRQWAVRIYVKPFVRWIWLGALVMALGALVCVLDGRPYHLKKLPSKKTN